ncbi:hypothetical protein EGW08_013788 [Elysia chlorotica]|uniref:Cytochrome P450 n=1 Tax=Elysia chlorotica TaxID=188477 RepID=A0A433TA13_ELYCH|nr:hypothetical protein EGW08_013788 [Elysia chlorotica]
MDLAKSDSSTFNVIFNASPLDYPQWRLDPLVGSLVAESCHAHSAADRELSRLVPRCHLIEEIEAALASWFPWTAHHRRDPIARVPGAFGCGAWTLLSDLSLLRAVMPTVLLIVSFLAWYHGATSSKKSKLPLPPGSLGLPIIGETLSLVFQGPKFFDGRRERYGSVYKTHLLGSPLIRVSGPDNVRKILLSENKLVTVYWPSSVRALLGEGTVSSAMGNLHRTRRKALQRAFCYEALSEYLPVMQKVVRDHIRRWCLEKVVRGYQECKNMTFAVSAETLAGFDMDSEKYRSLVHVFDVFADNLFCLPYHVPGLGFSKGMSARKRLLDEIGESLTRKTKRAEVEGVSNGSRNSRDALSRLLEDQGEESLTSSELKELCLELLFAGHATTASAATSLILQLYKHRGVLSKVQEELKANNLSEPGQGDLNMASLGQLEYVSAVVKEVLRLLPPVGGAYRTVLKSFTLNGYEIPAGWTLMYNIRNTHNSSDLFSNGDTFDPDRWLHHSSSSREEKFHYLPFGGGTRACVGKEFAKLFLKVFVVEIVRSCSWQLENDDVTMSYLPVPHPADGLPLSFTSIPSASL